MFMHKNPKYIPNFVDIEEFDRDFIAREQIENMLRKLVQLRQKLKDTKVLLNNGNYKDSMTFYCSVRYLVNEHDQESMPLYNELKQFFPNHTSVSKEEV